VPTQPSLDQPAIDAAWQRGEMPAAWSAVVGDVDPATLMTLLWMSRLARAFELALEDRLRGKGLIATELRVLNAVLLAGDARGVSPSRLQSTVLVSPGGITKAVDRLVAAGLVMRRADPDDGRAVLVALTAKGRRTATAVLRDLLGDLDARLAHLAVEQRAQVVDTLRTLLDALGSVRRTPG